jgi:hypothetical protein
VKKAIPAYFAPAIAISTADKAIIEAHPEYAEKFSEIEAHAQSDPTVWGQIEELNSKGNYLAARQIAYLNWKVASTVQAVENESKAKADRTAEAKNARMDAGVGSTRRSDTRTAQVAGVGANREDLLDLISNISPYDTPFVTSAPKVKANGVLHQWLVDTLAATSTAGAIEGGNWALDTTTRPSRLTNVTQIFRKDIAVSETQRSVNAAGFKDAYQLELMKAMREIARNIEVRIFQGSGNVTSGPASTTAATDSGRIMGNLQNFLTATANKGSYPAVPGTAFTELFASASSSAANLTVTMFNDALEQAFDNGGNPEQCFASPKLKRQISNFTATSQNRNIAAVEKKLVAAMDLYFSDFGLIEIVLDRWVPEATNTVTTTAASDCRGNLFFLERAKNRLAWLRPMQHTLIGKLGDSVAGTVLGEATLEVLAPAANVRLAGVNNITA